MVISPRHAVFFVFTQLVFLAVAATDVYPGDLRGLRTDRPRWWEVPGPVWETDPGFNLYWHDPNLGWHEGCRYWPPDVLGCPPLLYAKADALFLTRDVEGGVTFATVGGDEGPIALNTSDLDDEFKSGARVLLGCSLDHWYRIEGSFFATNSWSDTASVRNLDANEAAGTGDLFSPFSDFGADGGVLGLDYNNFASIRFTSELEGSELNLRRRVLMQPGRYEASILLGARYMKIDETFAYLTQSTTPGPATSSNLVALSTDNEMVGIQLGLTGQFLARPRYWVDFDVRGAMLHNSASQATEYTRTDSTGAVATFTGAAERDRTSFVGDLSLQMNCHCTRHLTVYCGYNAIWVAGVALGADNFNSDINILTLGPAALDHTGTAVYHGPNIGLVFAR